MEKLLITQALDERDLLKKRIADKIASARFVDTIKHNEDTTADTRKPRSVFEQDAQSAYQQIIDLIDRYDRLSAALIASNANTKIETSKGTMTIAGAIALKVRLKDGFEDGFETSLIEKMRNSLSDCVSSAETKNKSLQTTAEQMRLSILGKDGKVKDDKPLEVVESYIKENRTEIVDPLDLFNKISERIERKNALISELETKIKVSNATTFIEF